MSEAVSEVPPVPEVQEEPSLLDRTLMAYGAVGHGRLFCTCGYLIWSCPCTKGCQFTPRIIETDHALCKKTTK